MALLNARELILDHVTRLNKLLLQVLIHKQTDRGIENWVEASFGRCTNRLEIEVINRLRLVSSRGERGYINLS